VSGIKGIMDVYELDSYLRNLTPHQLKMVQTIYNTGGKWLTRAQVAKELGKRRLTPYDINCLTLLTEKKILSMDTQPTTAPGSDFAYIYTMPDEIAEVVQKWSEVRDQLRETDNPTKTRKPINLLPDD